MKYTLLALLILLFSSCADDEVPDYKVENEEEITAYILAHNLDAKKTASGLYYVIDEEGTGEQPTSTSVVTVVYKGYFTDGTVFSESSTEGYLTSLYGVIQGWTEGIPYFKQGGSGMLLVPAHLAYGADDNKEIPAGSVLIFDINLISVDYRAENEQEIVTYIQDNNLDAKKTDSGLYYVIEEEGTGLQPTTTSNVTVVYKGSFIDGTVFDESDSKGYFTNLQDVVEGWTEGIPYFKEGGSGLLLVPAHLGYGSYDYYTIPGGSVLLFDIELLSVDE